MAYLLGATIAVVLVVAWLVTARLRRLEERIARLEGRAAPGPYRSAPSQRDREREREPPASDEPAEEDPEVLAALEDGNLIAAIKRYREVTGAGLKEAKDAVEEIRDRMGPRPRI